MTLFNKTVTEAVVEVVKPASTTYIVEFTPDELATLIISISETCGIGVDLYRKLRQGVGMSSDQYLPAIPRNADGRTVVRRETIANVVRMMK